jgi:hypothetical protein
MPLSVFNDGGRTVKAHRLVVQQSACEGRQIPNFKNRARIREQCEAGRVRFRKAFVQETSTVDNAHTVHLSAMGLVHVVRMHLRTLLFCAGSFVLRA